MNHVYEFFDRAAVDRLWKVSWSTLAKRSPERRWLHSTKNQEDGYYGSSLRELLMFCVDPQQSPGQIENILRARNVTETIRCCSPQFFAMSELMHRALPHSNLHIVPVEVHNVTGLLTVAEQAFISKRISLATLWSVYKLHSIGREEGWQGSELSESVKRLLPWRRLWEPIYDWQGKQFKDDEWSNCLGIADTRRFVSFVLQAYSENWPAAPKPNSNGKIEVCFRDEPNCARLASSLVRVKKLTRPSVFRTWS
jgi:hypothetical protein